MATSATTLRPEKRAAIIDAARATFARLGYSRASIDAIASAAGVSTRTIYKHFAGKEQLFATVLVESATAVADAFTARAAASASGTPEERLLALAHAVAAQHLAHPEHFAMMRQIRHERDHFPPGVFAAWRKAGPDRVQAELGARLAALRDDGALALDDVPRAARQFAALVLAELGERGLDDASIAAAVHVFLHGSAARAAGAARISCPPGADQRR